MKPEKGCENHVVDKEKSNNLLYLRLYQDKKGYNNILLIINYIIELGKLMGVTKDIPLIKDKNLILDYIYYSGQIKKSFENLEKKVNGYISEIDGVLLSGNRCDVELMEKIIFELKAVNKREKILEAQKKEKLSMMLRNEKTLNRLKKYVIIGKKVPFDYPFIKGKFGELERKKSISKISFNNLE